MKRLWLFAFTTVLFGCSEVVPGSCYPNPAGGAGGADSVAVGAGVGATTSGDFISPPPGGPLDYGGDPNPCIAPQSPCNEKCLADYEAAAGECGKIENEAQRTTCQDATYAKYRSCRENCPRTEPRPPREDCRGNVVRCLETKIAKNCEPCLRYCEGQGRWEDWAGGGTIDCRWWLYE